MQKKIFLPFIFFLLSITTAITANPPSNFAIPRVEPYEDKPVGKITIIMETLKEDSQFDPELVLNRLRTKEGDRFSQYTFDQDLKMLSDEYDRVEPTIRLQDGEVWITIKLWQKPLIKNIIFVGNQRISSKKLLKELGIKPGTVFNREAFNKGFNKLKEFYVKRGYFEALLSYTILPDREANDVVIQIDVNEGRSGHVNRLIFKGFTRKEEKELIEMINTKRYNLLTSWLTGTGFYHEEALAHDKLVIVNYLQNKGYADAKVDLEVSESQDGRIIIHLSAERGELYHFGSIAMSGNALFTEKEIENVMLVHPGEVYAPDKLRDSMQQIKTLYGSKGHIEANVQYQLRLAPDKPVYDVLFEIQEGEKYRIGVIRVLGNVQTNTKVILRESLLVPGEIFDSRKLQATEQRLQGMGYFKSVNVYAVRTSDDRALGPNYRDVIIEVDEATTGNLSLFFGFSSVDSLFGGLDLTENNFNYKGIGKTWKDGLSAVRGGGEYAHARLQIGSKQDTYLVSWMTPYFRDTLWRVGFDLNYTHSRLQSSDYDIDTLSLVIYGSYPLTPYWTSGWKGRFKNAWINISKDAGPKAEKQEDNSGITIGAAYTLNYDSTDNTYKPRRGFRSYFEGEFGGITRYTRKAFPFVKLSYLNSYYYPIWKRGILKLRAEFRYLVPFTEAGEFKNVPLSERFFLGGENSVRGYRPFSIGKSYEDKKDPQGGISSILLSVEYLQEIFKLLDGFVFFDGGTISEDRFGVYNFNMSYGVGARIEVGNRLPLILGIGFPINPDDKEQVRRFFFAMGGQF